MAHWKRFIYVVIALFSLQLTARAQETETFVHTIKQGETVYSITRTYQVSPESILKLNPTTSTGIKAGETLTIPQQQNGTQEKRFHTIQAGETLYKLTKTYQVPTIFAKPIRDLRPKTSKREWLSVSRLPPHP